MRILLVRPGQPKASRGLKRIMRCEPLELEYLAASVPNHDVKIHDMLISDSLSKILESFNPHVVGTTCYMNNVPEALDICRYSKSINPEIKTIIGGVHATLNSSEFERDFVDIIVLGEGVWTFRNIVESLEAGKQLDPVKGIGFRNEDGFCYTSEGEFPKDLDQLPFPNRNLTREYRKNYFYLTRRPLTIMKTSWGCPYRCTFCYNRRLTGNNYYARSPESVISELETIDTKHVFIVDDAFIFNKPRLIKLYKLIKERRIKKEFLAYGRTDFIAANKDLLQKWKDIGLKLIRVGLEAITDEDLRKYKKKNTILNNNKAIQICREIGIDLSASFLLHPSYTRHDFRRLRDYIFEKQLIYFFINPLTPLPGTELFDKYKHQLIVKPRSGHALWDFQHCVIKTTSLPLNIFYREMGLTYMTPFNPFRRKNMKGHPKSLPPLSLSELKLYGNLIVTLLTTFLSHRDHKRIATEEQTLKPKKKDRKTLAAWS